MSSLTYFGPPGTGKTTTLIGEVRQLATSGVPLEKIGYSSFTRQAVKEAITRLDSPVTPPFFKTTHALCFGLLGTSPSAIMRVEHYHELGEKLGLELTGGASKYKSREDLSVGDLALGIVEKARLTGISTRAAWETMGAEETIDWLLVDLLDRALAEFKAVNCLVDFTDLLVRYVKNGPVPELAALVVDEAQDLSPLQWQVIDKLASSCDRLIIAGDEDQAIYAWAGASVRHFIEKSRLGTSKILDKSHRLPRKIYELAMKIVLDIGQRVEKPFSPRDAEGLLDWRVSLDDVDMTTGQWLILYRNQYMAREAISHCRRSGLYYSCFMDSTKTGEAIKAAYVWEDLRANRLVSLEDLEHALGLAADWAYSRSKLAALKLSKESAGKLSPGAIAPFIELNATLKRPWFEVLTKLRPDDVEYIRAMLRRGEKLREPPRIRIDTIHGAKGAECDNVVLGSDVSYKSWKSMERDPDAERRVFYVGVTRARSNLYILQPETPYYFDLERL